MKKGKKQKHFIQKPIYPGGFQALKKFVSKNKRYPKEASENNIEGTVRVKYDVNHKGKVISTKVLIGIGYGCDEEAERIVSLLEFEVPKTRKTKVLFHKTINIHFVKPETKKMPLKLIYSYVEKAKKTSVKEKKKLIYNYKFGKNISI